MSISVHVLLVGHGSIGGITIDRSETLNSVRNKIFSQFTIPVQECIYFFKPDLTGIIDDLTRENIITANEVISNDSILMTPESHRPDSPPRCIECHQTMLWYPTDHITLSYVDFNFSSITKVSHRRSNYVVAQYHSSRMSHKYNSNIVNGSISFFEICYCSTVNCKNRGRLYDATSGVPAIR